MILKGSQRSGAAQLAGHLMNQRDNDHVHVLELRGFVANDLNGAFHESHAIAKATKCKQFLFSLSLNPPADQVVGEEAFLEAAKKAEHVLGLEGQPRAVIIHEKEGRRHAHVVWSRIKGDTLKAVNLPFFKDRLNRLSKELYLEHGWTLPDGLKAYGGKSPLNFTREEWQQAQRQQIDPREIKAVFREAWEKCDGLKGFGNALAERGYFIARGDRRGFVAIDVQGEVYSLPRWSGVRTKEMRAKFGDPTKLESVSAVKTALRARISDQLKRYIRDVKDRHKTMLQPLKRQQDQMIGAQRRERATLDKRQKSRWDKESKERVDRYRSGLKGFLDVFTGRAAKIRKSNEAEALRHLKRDQVQRDDLAKAQLIDRQVLQQQIDAMRATQRQDRKILARDVTQFLRNAELRSEEKARNHRTTHRDHTPEAGQSHNIHHRKSGPDLTR